MRSMGPLWAFVLTVDRNLVVALALTNFASAIGVVVVGFRGRPRLDRVLILFALFVLFMIASVVGLHLFARTPIRDLQFFQIWA